MPRMTEIRQKMHTEIESLWLTDEMQILKPTVIDEVSTISHKLSSRNTSAVAVAISAYIHTYVCIS